MKLFKWLKELFSRKRILDQPILPQQVIECDPNIQEICAKAWNASKGHAIIGYVDDSGKLHTEEIVIDPDQEISVQEGPVV